jgi:nitrogenase molybdenum-iron protein alpha/beta subunit
MTGAADCIAGFDGTVVVIHGSSGCYYYPATLLHASLHGTFIIEKEVIFGSEQRLLDVIKTASSPDKRVAVITTCVPAILGEDIKAMLDAQDVLLIDSPGFSGSFEEGYMRALRALDPQVDPRAEGVNIDGISLFDPFSGGNLRELSRLCAKAHVPVAAVFSSGALFGTRHASPFTIGTNTDIGSGIGRNLGGSLGLKELADTFRSIGEACDQADTEPVLREIERGEERVVQSCDRFLRRFDPPRTAIFGWPSYAMFAAGTLAAYLDADIALVGTRTQHQGDHKFPVHHVCGLAQVQALIGSSAPDLILGSSFERPVNRSSGFVGLTPPLRGRVRLASRPMAGVEGTLHLIEDVLNACMDRQR